MTRRRPALFRGRHFEDVIILLCVRWYLRYSPTYRDLEEIMAERGLSVDHVTIWRVDETYVKVVGSWAYLYRAVDGHPAYASAVADLKQTGETRSPLSLSNGTLFEQHHRAGPSLYQEADHGKPRIPFGGGCMSNDRGLRGDACNPKRADPLGR